MNIRTFSKPRWYKEGEGLSYCKEGDFVEDKCRNDGVIYKLIKKGRYPNPHELIDDEGNIRKVSGSESAQFKPSTMQFSKDTYLFRIHYEEGKDNNKWFNTRAHNIKEATDKFKERHPKAKMIGTPEKIEDHSEDLMNYEKSLSKQFSKPEDLYYKSGHAIAWIRPSATGYKCTCYAIAYIRLDYEAKSIKEVQEKAKSDNGFSFNSEISKDEFKKLQDELRARLGTKQFSKPECYVWYDKDNSEYVISKTGIGGPEAKTREHLFDGSETECENYIAGKTGTKQFSKPLVNPITSPDSIAQKPKLNTDIYFNTARLEDSLNSMKKLFQ